MNIVLAHGILGFDQIGPVEYFNGVANYLANNYGANVLATAVDPIGSIEKRGGQLRKQILDDLNKDVALPVPDPDDETHIIVHSMGGLDSRYILSPKNNDNIAGLITSLTTIGTPHQGTPIADLLYRRIDGNAHSPIVSLWERQVRESLAFFGISTDGLESLTTAAILDFNANYEDNDDVHYFRTAGVGRSSGPITSFPFRLTHQYINKNGKTGDEKRNDGIVPLSSARHGVQIGRDWLADHADEIGHDLDNPLADKTRKFPHLDRYDEIIACIAPLKKSKKTAHAGKVI